jgi:phospholipase D1/2
MRPAPHPNADQTEDPEDTLIADPLADATLNLWNDTARKNREIFTEIFRPVPTNLVRDWPQYDVRFYGSLAFVYERRTDVAIRIMFPR